MRNTTLYMVLLLVVELELLNFNESLSNPVYTRTALHRERSPSNYYKGYAMRGENATSTEYSWWSSTRLRGLQLVVSRRVVRRFCFIVRFGKIGPVTGREYSLKLFISIHSESKIEPLVLAKLEIACLDE